MKKIMLLGAVLASFLLTACNDKTDTFDEFKVKKEIREEDQGEYKNGELDGELKNGK